MQSAVQGNAFIEFTKVKALIKFNQSIDLSLLDSIPTGTVEVIAEVSHEGGLHYITQRDNPHLEFKEYVSMLTSAHFNLHANQWVTNFTVIMSKPMD